MVPKIITVVLDIRYDQPKGHHNTMCPDSYIRGSIVHMVLPVRTSPAYLMCIAYGKIYMVRFILANLPYFIVISHGFILIFMSCKIKTTR